MIKIDSRALKLKYYALTDNTLREEIFVKGKFR